MRTPSGKRAASWSVAVAVCLAVSWCTAAQGPDKKTEKDGAQALTRADEDFWFSTPIRKAASAAQLVAARNPFAIAVMRQKARDELIWGDLEFARDVAPPLDPEWLDGIRDGRPMPNVAGKAEDEIAKADRAMYQAFSQAIINAFEQPPDVFRKSARDNEFLKFPQLWNDPRNHRGKVITVNGRMARLRQWEAPVTAKKQGIKYVYEGWVFGETKNAHPYALIFPVLPDGLEVSESMNRKVTFHGYFLGKILVRTPKGDIETPLAIGPTVIAERATVAPTEESTPFSLMVLIGVVALLFGTATVIMGLSWYFRKGDEAIQQKLANRNEKELLALMEDAERTVPSPDHENQPEITANPPEPHR